MKRTAILIGILAGVSLLMAFLFSDHTSLNLTSAMANALQEDTLVEQRIIDTLTEPEKITTVYYLDQKIGVLYDEEKLDAYLEYVYNEKYSEQFPDSSVGLGEDLHMSTQYSYYVYENKDEEIINYIDQEQIFSIYGYKVEFSNGEVIYVTDIDEFNRAKEEYVLNYFENDGIDPQYVYDTLNSGSTVEEFSNKDLRDISYSFKESQVVTADYIPVSQAMSSEEEYMKWLSFGDHLETEWYTVQEFDTIEGIAWQRQISKMNLMTINKDQIKSEDQILKVGMQLNVAKMNSPIHVEVTKERTLVEAIRPEATLYKYDETLREGMSYTETEYKEGKRRVLMKEVYDNDEMVSAEEVSSIVLEPAQQEVVVIGTKVIPGIGTGSFSYPVDYPTISCGWLCYYGHTALDIQNYYNRYGNVYASDRGVVEENSYHYINGYYMVINHNNGFRTYYGHMNGPGYVPVGVAVEKGEIIGQIGMSGLATGPHVHFEIRTGGYGTSVYPYPYLGG